MKNIKFLTISIIFSSLIFFRSFSSALAANSAEADILCALNNMIPELNCGQAHYKFGNGNHPYPYCPGSVCWNSSSLVGSSSDLENVLGYAAYIDASGYPGAKGDVRIRFRYQNNTLYGFAYRCAAPEPAGCEQLWRAEWKFPVGCVLESTGCEASVKITDVGLINDFSGSCAHNNYTCE